MFIAVNKIQAPAPAQQAMKEGFRKAAPSMKQFKGFLGMELWTADDNTLMAVSRWESKEDMEEYLKNDLFQRHHAGTSTGSASEQAHGGPTYYNAEIIG